MSDVRAPNRFLSVLGWVFIALGLAVFAVRLQHEGPYAFPRRGNLAGGLGAIAVGALLVVAVVPRILRWAAVAASPILLFSGTYAILSELEEVVSLYATHDSGSAAELRLWVVDDANGE